MSRNRTTTVTSACLVGAGALAWALLSKPLAGDANLDFPVNAFGIDRSPYGEVFAMAMQGPIDTYFDGPAGHQHDESCDHDHDHEDHDHEETAKSKPASLTARFENLIASLNQADSIRTNPRGESKTHKLYLRRQVEDRLRFAYNLDPSHYGNYNALHFFLTEPELGTRPELTPTAAKLAQDTVDYCLKREDDPRPALTAAAACTNILELMYKDSTYEKPKFTTAQMRQILGMLDHCIARYGKISDQWTAAGQWQNLSQMRIDECAERLHFILKVRDTQAAIIDRLEGKTEPQVSR
jgi:hypothetical protein